VVKSFSDALISQRARNIACRDPALRVRAAFDFDAQDLSNRYGMSKVALGLHPLEKQERPGSPGLSCFSAISA
jgi:hypothetical protein